VREPFAHVGGQILTTSESQDLYFEGLGQGWSDSTFVELRRDGDILATIDAEDLWISGTTDSYQYGWASLADQIISPGFVTVAVVTGNSVVSGTSLVREPYLGVYASDEGGTTSFEAYAVGTSLPLDATPSLRDRDGAAVELRSWDVDPEWGDLYGTFVTPASPATYVLSVEDPATGPVEGRFHIVPEDHDGPAVILDPPSFPEATTEPTTLRISRPGSDFPERGMLAEVYDDHGSTPTVGWPRGSTGRPSRSSCRRSPRTAGTTSACTMVTSRFTRGSWSVTNRGTAGSSWNRPTSSLATRRR
jgi:hypothetical protein